MKSTKKIITNIISIFIIILGIITILNTDLIFAKEDNVFYLNNLIVGDFIPNDSTLVGTDSYYASSNRKNIQVILQATEEDKNIGISDQTVTVEKNNLYSVKKYNDYFTNSQNEKEYDGWVVAGFHIMNGIILMPAEKYNKIETNDYKVIASCSDDSIPKTTWYKEKEIASPTLISQNNIDWTIENNKYEYVIWERSTSDDRTSSLKFNFTAQKGDYFAFDIRSNQKREYILNGVSGNLVDIAAYNEGYKMQKISIDNEGDNEFILNNLTLGTYRSNGDYYKYEANAFGLKNYRLLTLINEGDKLDTTKVESKDIIYYECECADGYIYNDTLEYIAKPEINNETINNPETSSTILYVTILIGLFISTGIIIKTSSKNL